MTQSFEHIRGDTFIQNFELENAGPVSHVYCQIKNRQDTLISTANIIQTDDFAYVVRVDDTTQWPIGSLYFDLEFHLEDNIIQSTPMMRINVRRDVTINV